MVEVTNTPWHERTAYVLPGTGIHRAAKGMHVSPFLPMGLTHRFTIGEPGRRLTLAVDDFDGDDLVFAASMALTRAPAGRRAQGRLLWRFPLMTLRVSLGIYRQALALRRKGVPFHRTSRQDGDDGGRRPERRTGALGMAELPVSWIGSRAGTPVATRFLRYMASHLRGGTLVVVDDNGTHRFGGGHPEVTMTVHDPVVYWDTLLQGSVGLGRDYADGLWDCDDLPTLTRVLNRGLRPVTAVQDRVGQAVGVVHRLVPSAPTALQARRPQQHPGPLRRLQRVLRADAGRDDDVLLGDVRRPGRSTWPPPSGPSSTDSAPSSASGPTTTSWRSVPDGAASPATPPPTTAAG